MCTSKTKSSKKLEIKTTNVDIPVRTPKVTKRDRSKDSFDLEGFLKDDSIVRQTQHDELLGEIRQGNKEYAKYIRITETFQQNFLTLLSNKL